MLKFLAIILLFASCISANDLKWVKEPTMVHDEKENNWKISFEINQESDVEVGIIETEKNTIIRHLAAGSLGKNPPAPLIENSNAQNIIWDGKDDFGVVVSDTSKIALQVRVGMSVSVKNIVGGDPYAFYSKEMGQGDHAAWRITGLEVKANGNVFVMGNGNNLGPPTIRQYNGNGEYQRTVFPIPAGKTLESVSGWGVYAKPNNTYSPKYNDDLSSPALSLTLISATRGGCAFLFPSPSNETLTLRMGSQKMTIGVDSTLADYKPLPVVVNPVMAKGEVMGAYFNAYSTDKKTMYLSGIFSRNPLTKKEEVLNTGFWRDGQVWKIDVATGVAEPFFSLPEDKVIRTMNERGASPIGHVSANEYSAFHGIAVDSESNVFVCDRQNQRIIILDKIGKIIREIPLANPDAIAVNPKSKAIFVTTRFGNYHKNGKLELVKFNDWSKDTVPVITQSICSVGMYFQPSYLGLCETPEGLNIWLAYTTIPVRIYRDMGATLSLVKDFYEASSQRALDMQHLVVDQKTDDVYISDGWGSCFKISDWSSPKFQRCMVDDKTPLSALSLGIDFRNRKIYGHGDRKSVMRYKMDNEYYAFDSLDSTKKLGITPILTNDWRIGLGFGDRGIAVATDGSLATLAAFGTGPEYSGRLNYFASVESNEPWPSLCFEKLGKARLGGVKFDLQGNLYVGKVDAKPNNTPVGFEKDSNFANTTGRIYKFKPTRIKTGGSLYPTEPEAPQKTYDIHYGSIAPSFSRTSRFGVDGFGRIYYPTTLLPQVSVIDNEGNSILSFGTYGNRDSMGGLKGELITTKDIPLAWPNSVDATDNFIYVSDFVNIRVLQLEKKFVLSAISKK